MAYIYSVNNTTYTGPQVMFKLLTIMSSSGWSVKSSGDGSSWFSLSGSILTGSGTGVGNLGNNSAWFVVQQPSGNRQFLFQRGTSNIAWKMLYSYAGMFTGTANGAISATVHPTAVDAAVVLGGLPNGTTATMFSTDGSYTTHIVADNASPYGWYVYTQPSSGNSTMIFMDPLTSGSYPTEEVDPYVYGAFNGSTTMGTYQATTTTFSCWYKKGTAAESFAQTPMVAIGSSTTANVNLGYNPYTGNLDLIPIVWGRGTGAHSPPIGYKGISYFFRMPSVTLTRLAYSTTPGARDWVIVGDIAMRWVGEPFM